MAGWRTALVIMTVGAIGLFGGPFIGTMAAILAGWREMTLLRRAEMFIVVPTLIVALTAAAVFGLSPLSAGLRSGWPISVLIPCSPIAWPNAHSVCPISMPRMSVADFQLMMHHILPGTMPVLLP